MWAQDNEIAKPSVTKLSFLGPDLTSKPSMSFLNNTFENDSFELNNDFEIDEDIDNKENVKVEMMWNMSQYFEESTALQSIYAKIEKLENQASI